MFMRILLAVLVLTGCYWPTDDILSRAYAVDPVPGEYRGWWREVEQCSGLKGDFDRVTWLVVPNVTTLMDGVPLAGRTYLNQHTTVMAGSYLLRGMAVRHEMLHHLHGVRSHDELYFVTKCGSIVFH